MPAASDLTHDTLTLATRRDFAQWYGAQYDKLRKVTNCCIPEDEMRGTLAGYAKCLRLLSEGSET